ncbi:MAG: DUF4271 domain-containing protein [Muribaculum sp.]|nr:DUF4271 domain-containing protein [Muribaculum sp.]
MNGLHFTIDQNDVSWIYLLLFVIFFLTCTRVKGNFKFAGAFLRDVIGVRERENMFDVTVRETSFMLFAVLLSSCSLGVLLCKGVLHYGNLVWSPADIPDITISYEGILIPMGICMGLACAYTGLMWLTYYSVGHVFSDNLHTKMWVRGFTSSIALGGAVFLPLALIALAYPEYSPTITIVGLFMLILVKIVFIVKGFRIFFTESSLWVVFLYYLCSLEIIPMTITFGLASSLLG